MKKRIEKHLADKQKITEKHKLQKVTQEETKSE